MTDLSLAHHIGAILARAGEDADPAETAEWCEALDALTAAHGPARARFMLDALLAHARRRGVALAAATGHAVRQHDRARGPAAVPRRPGDGGAPRRADALERAGDGGARQPERPIGRARRPHRQLRVAADLFEVGFNHFFRARDDAQARGDLVFFQPHSAPGVYARAFLEGRLSEDDLAHYRQELTAPAHGARGLTIYPHP